MYIYDMLDDGYHCSQEYTEKVREKLASAIHLCQTAIAALSYGDLSPSTFVPYWQAQFEIGNAAALMQQLVNAIERNNVMIYKESIDRLKKHTAAAEHNRNIGREEAPEVWAAIDAFRKIGDICAAAGVRGADIAVSEIQEIVAGAEEALSLHVCQDWGDVPESFTRAPESTEWDTGKTTMQARRSRGKR